MARQTSDIFIRLGIENLEGIDKLKSAFRELDKTLGVSNTTITTARQRINEYIAGTTRSEQAINGQLAALRGLRSQVDINGRGYQELTSEIAQLQGELRGSTAAIDRQREVLLRNVQQSGRSTQAAHQYREALLQLQSQTRSGSDAYNQLGDDIDRLTRRMEEASTVASRLRSAISRGLPKSVAGAAVRLDDLAKGIELQRDLIAQIDLLPAKQQKAADAVERRAAAEASLNAALSEQRQLTFQERARTGREQARTGAAAFNAPPVGGSGYLSLEKIEQRLGPLPDTINGINQELAELRERLDNTFIGGETYVSILDRMTQATNRLREATETVTPRQQTINAIRERIEQQRRVSEASGFRAFSARVSGRSLGPEDEAQAYAAVNAASAAMEEAYVARFDAARAGIRRNTELEVQQMRLLDEEDEKTHQATMQRMADEAAAGTKWFNEQMAMDKVTRRRNLMSQALGMGQRDLSPFYQRVVGLGSAGVERQQMFMGKSPTDVYNDIVKSFRMGERTDLLSGVKDAAANVTDTLSDGLEQGSPKAKSAAEKLAEAVKTGIKRAFGIASPSKFIISVVQNLAKTWEDELRSASPRLQLAAERAFGLSGPRRMTSRFVNTIEGKQIVPATNYRALPVRSLDVSTQGPEMDAMMRRFRQQIAALTSQPAIYENLLNALPSSRLTTNLVGLANQRMGMTAQYPDYLPGLRRIEARGGPRLQQTPGVDIFDLENEIKRLASSYFREIRVPNPWVGAIGDYKKFIDAIEFDTKQLRTQALLSGTRIAGALPPVAESIGGLRQQRIAEAYRRSSERGLRVLAADAFADQGPLALPPANYGFAADPARIGRLMARGRRGRPALPPAIDIQATPVVEEATVAAESTSLRATVKDFFARLRAGVGSAFGGGAGGRPPIPPVGAGGAGPGDLGPKVAGLKSTLLDFGPIAQRSIRDLQDLRSVLQEQAASMAPGAAGSAMRQEYDTVLKTIEQQDKRLEREIERRNRSRQRLGGRQIAQIGGAAISGGIFGGPEGFLGGVIGGAFGGVGGSFAGAAAGAQVGMLRQQLAGTTAYAAEIGKMQIALRGVSGTQANYNQAIQAAARLTNELNIPQREATAGLTRLSAAVLGAGGTMNDATFAFRAISESIKATGGNAEQVDGALLALTQVFSKGKVSAEELNQIAERLPGTFTLFAKATGKTGPELQKALQQGTVGLNDLMKFLELARSKNAATALEISKSSEDAGARMTIAFQKMALEVGKVLQPIGAQFQDAFAGFATQATPGVIDATQKFGGLLKAIMDNGAAIAAIAKLAVQFGIATYAVKAFTALQGPFVTAMRAMEFAMGNNSMAAKRAAVDFRNFARTVGTVARSLAPTLVLTVAIVGAEIVIDTLRRIDEAKRGIRRQYTQQSTEAWVKGAGGAAQTKEGWDRIIKQQLIPASNQTKELMNNLMYDIKVNAPIRNNLYRTKEDEQAFLDSLRKGDYAYSFFNDALAARLKLLETAQRTERERYNAALRAREAAPTEAQARRQSFPSPISAADEAKQKRDTAAADAQRTAESLAQQEMRLADAVFDHKQDLERKRYELSKELLDLETKNRLDQMGSIEREAAQALEQRRSRDVEYQERLRDINDQIAKAQRDLLSAQRMAAVTGGAPGRAGLPTGVSGYITGDPSSPYYRADHGGRNYHEHLSFVSRQAAEAAYNLLVRAGVRVTEFQGRGQVGRHAQGSAHYAGLAFDVPASQVPVGQERALTARVQRLLGIGAPGATGAQGRRNIADVGDVGIARSALETKLLERKLIIDEKARRGKAADIELANSLTSAFRSQNEELSNTLRTETLRAELQSKGYTSAQVDLELKLADALDRRNKLIAVASADTRLNDETRALAISNLNAKYQEQVDLLNKIYELNHANANSFGFREGAQRYVESIGTMRDATAQLTESGLKGLEDVLVQLTTTGTANFQEFAASILQQSARMIMQLLIQKTIMQIIGAIGGGGGGGGGGLGNFGLSLPGVGYTAPVFGNANGNVFAANGIVPYAMGGIVTRPTLFPFANGGSIGTGLMGEAGHEAVIPLQRGANGKLGVAGGGGTTNIVVNVDASGGTSVSGDEAQAKQLGQAVTAAVQAELIKQKRPGGLLSR